MKFTSQQSTDLFAATSITQQYNQIFGSPEQFIQKFKSEVEPKVDAFMGALIAVYLFTLVVKVFTK